MHTVSLLDSVLHRKNTNKCEYIYKKNNENTSTI